MVGGFFLPGVIIIWGQELEEARRRSEVALVRARETWAVERETWAAQLRHRADAELRKKQATVFSS